MKRKGKLPFDPKVFLSKVNGGRTISEYRKDHHRKGRRVHADNTTAGKPANDAGQPAAEPTAAEPNAAKLAEPRAGAKGNVDQQSTCLTQSWISVSQALDRIRKVARERKKERFTTEAENGEAALNSGLPS